MAELADANGPRYWRTLEELAGTEAFRELVAREFPEQATEWTDPTSRRRFLKLMAASLAFGGLGLSGCARQPQEKIVPHVHPPEDVVPGQPLQFATTMSHDGTAIGLIVNSREGRPIKIEGNPQHSASLGATDVFAQAEILSLYDPDRSQTVREAGRISTWGAALSALKSRVRLHAPRRGAGMRILSETVTSPTLLDQCKRWLEKFPDAQWHEWDAVNRDNARSGTSAAFGQPFDTVHHFDRADVVLSLDASFLTQGPGHLRDTRGFMRGRMSAFDGQQNDKSLSMNRLYVVECTPSTTGGLADHRLLLRPSQVPAFAQAVAAAVGVAVPRPEPRSLTGIPPKWITAVADDLRNYARERNPRRASLVLAGDGQPPVVHMLACAINRQLGNIGTSVEYVAPPDGAPPSQRDSLTSLVRDIERKRVQTLIILGGNPAFTAPADLSFAVALKRVAFRLHLGREFNETADACRWHIPQLHFLESWSDARAHDGLVSLVQPLIAPLYVGKTSHEILSMMLDEPGKSSHQIVRDYWRRRAGSGDFETFWQTALHDGVVPDTRSRPATVTFREEALRSVPAQTSGEAVGDKLEIVLRPDPTVWDGRYANNGWLQELPKPLTKITWDNAVLIGPALAAQRGLKNGDLVELKSKQRSIEIPVWILPGQPDGTVTVHFGNGRRKVGRVGHGVGFDVYPLRTSDGLWHDFSGDMQKLDRTHRIAATHTHHLMDGRHLIRSGAIDDVRANPRSPKFMGHDEPADSLLPEWKYDGYKWGMSINLNACTGCNACVIACQAENNIPVVGKQQVLKGREMHWIRIDTHYEGPASNPAAHQQPVPCMHCEQAPCEIVCPVGATVHSSEGLNQMVYNRCVGTRYCSNNCPYKVRRFNFLQYTDYETPVLKLLNNPEVTVRSRGVMEKCTYCVQRISHATIEAEKRTRPGQPEVRIADGSLQTACQQACPAEAIVFGDLNTNGSRVARLQADPLNYALLEELNTRPRTTYLAAVRNPNPDLTKE